MVTQSRTLEYLRLFRFHTAGTTALTPVIGALTVGVRSIEMLAALFSIGIFYHIYLFVLNEHVDIDIDKVSSALKAKPLVSGRITRRESLTSVVISCLLVYALTLAFFPSVLVMMLLTLAIVLGGLYDLFGKRVLAFDYVLATGFFFLCLFGASVASSDFTPATYLVSLVYFVHIGFNNSVEGGLKDVDHDMRAGGRTLISTMGVRVTNGWLHVTTGFKAYAIVLKLAFVAFIALLAAQPGAELWPGNGPLRVIMIALLIVASFAVTHSFLSRHIFDRARLLRLFSLHEMSSYFLLIAVLWPLIGASAAVVLVLLPLTWFVALNVVLYGKALQPRI